MTTPATRVITAHIPAALAGKVDAVAERLERSRGWVMKEALAAWVELEEQRYRLTLEALKDVEKGRQVKHEDVAAWAATLDRTKPSRPPKCK